MSNNVYVKANKKESYLNIAEQLYNLISQNILPNQEIVIVCIGTNNVIFDSLGPMVGYFLNQYESNLPVYGSNQNTVNAENLQETIDTIYSTYNDPFVIAVDASLGYREHIGYITISNDSLKPGRGLSKELGEIGDISITGITATKYSLDNVSIFKIIEMAKCIALGINYANRYLLPPNSNKPYNLSYFEYNL